LVEPGSSQQPPDASNGGQAPGTAAAHTAWQIAYRVEVRTADATGADFADTLHAVLTDPRGWRRAGFAFTPDPEARVRVVLVEGDEIDGLCAPYDTGGRYSCQNAPVVALNADRWRHATEQWEGDLAGYRTMLINHEVGHLLHLRHPEPQCPGPGLPASVMAQRSSGAAPCRPHPWPLRWEVELAGERRERLVARRRPRSGRPPSQPTARHAVTARGSSPPPGRAAAPGDIWRRS
jgi:hypothetical protein